MTDTLLSFMCVKNFWKSSPSGKLSCSARRTKNGDPPPPSITKTLFEREHNIIIYSWNRNDNNTI